MWKLVVLQAEHSTKVAEQQLPVRVPAYDTEQLLIDHPLILLPLLGHRVHLNKGRCWLTDRSPLS